MKKYFVLLFFCLCSCVHEYNQSGVYAVSNEKGTNIFVNDEYMGSETAAIRVLNRKSSNSYVRGEKKGCKSVTLPLEYRFDASVFWIINPKQLMRLFTGNVYILDENKTIYNVTPRCD